MSILQILKAKPYEWSDLPEITRGDYRSFGGSIEWRFDSSGVTIRQGGIVNGPMRTPGEPITVLTALELYGDAIYASLFAIGSRPN